MVRQSATERSLAVLGPGLVAHGIIAPDRGPEHDQRRVAGQRLGECEGQERHDEDGGHHAPELPGDHLHAVTSASCARAPVVFVTSARLLGVMDRSGTRPPG